MDDHPSVCLALWRTSACVCVAVAVLGLQSPKASASAQAGSLASRHANEAALDDVAHIHAARTQSFARSDDTTMVNIAAHLASDGLSFGNNIAPLRINVELQQRKMFAKPPAIVHFVGDLAPGARRLLHAGLPAVTLVTRRVTTWDGFVVDEQIVGKRLVQRSRPSEIAVGPPRNVAEALALAKLRRLSAVFSMIATAYTAGSAQSMPTGYTANGMRARFGVVAVDPRLIPLGSHLFIPGYGNAVAADTGGAIVGNRIDLCMDSLQAALSFGRQPVTVYVLGR